MRITKAGLLFSGPTAYISNMSYAPILVDGIPHDSNEEAHQYKKAKTHGLDELAEAIHNMENSYEIKKDGGEIVTTEEWNENAPNDLWKLFDIKMRSHPDLLERLMETAPLKLIEASKDTRWGGGAPFNSKLYDNDEQTGNNEFGVMATKYRDDKIRQRQKP